MDRIKKNWRLILLCILLAGVIVAVFSPVSHYDIIYYDDPQYVTENPQVIEGLTWPNIKWAMTAICAGNWHPLTLVSHMADVQLFGLKIGRHHLVSLLFHTANSLLLFLLLNRMTGAIWRSAFVAAAFALHPLHVESVAWLAERKDVLSGFFFMLTLGAYARYAQRRSRAELSLRTLDYSLALVFFALGLMSKPMLVTLPFVLLLLDYWPLGRLSLLPSRHASTPPLQSAFPHFRALVWEKAPFFALSLVSSVITFMAQRRSEAVSSLEQVAFERRLGNALLSCVAYLKQAFWPTGLALPYPYPAAVSEATVVAAAVLLAGITVLAFLLVRRHAYVAVGWFWYVGMLVPVIGLVQVGEQARADRYTYLPLIGVFLTVAWGVPALAAQISILLWPSPKFRSAIEKKPKFPSPQPSPHGRGSPVVSRAAKPATSGFSRVGQDSSLSLGERAGVRGIQFEYPPDGTKPGLHPLGRALSAAAIVVLAALGWTTHRQVQYWRSSYVLFQHAAEVTQDNYVARQGMGIALLREGKYDEAMTNLNVALDLARSRGAGGGINYYLGAALQLQGRGIEALPYFQAAIVGPDLRPQRDLRLGLSLLEAGRVTEAEAALKSALAARPRDAEFQLAEAMLFHSLGRDSDAEASFRRIVAAHPELAQAHRSYGDFLSLLGRSAEAEAQYAAAVKLASPDLDLLRAYAAVLGRLGKTGEAVEQLEAALKQAPNNAQVNFELAEFLSERGQKVAAVARYNRALEANPKLVSALNNLAWMLATDPDESIRNGARAVELAERACQQTEWKAAVLMGTLAAAYAEAGRFSDAGAMAQRARDKARIDQQEAIAKRNEELLEVYRAGKPFREIR